MNACQGHPHNICMSFGKEKERDRYQNCKCLSSRHAWWQILVSCKKWVLAIKIMKFCGNAMHAPSEKWSQMLGSASTGTTSFLLWWLMKIAWLIYVCVCVFYLLGKKCSMFWSVLFLLAWLFFCFMETLLQSRASGLFHLLAYFLQYPPLPNLLHPMASTTNHCPHTFLQSHLQHTFLHSKDLLKPA